jgi:pyruvate decarboxylase
LLIKKENMISLQFDRVEIGNGPSFSCVLMKDFLLALAKKVKKNTASFDNYSRMYVPPSVPLKQKPGEPLRTVNLFKHIQVLHHPF